MIKVLVTGSREFWSSAPVRRVFRDLQGPFVLISGMARGPDVWAAEEVEARGLPVMECPANWRPNGKFDPGAGYKRNAQMLALEPDIVIAFWDTKSRGTAHTIGAARAKGIPIIVFEDDGDIPF